MIDQARLLTLKAAHMMDTVGNKAARAEIAMIKVVAPNMSCKVVDRAIQAHGGAGVSQDFRLAEAYAHQRTVRLVDGPDEVHRNADRQDRVGEAGGRRARWSVDPWAASRSAGCGGRPELGLGRPCSGGTDTSLNPMKAHSTRWVSSVLPQARSAM